jgi:hypothetical protein
MPNLTIKDITTTLKGVVVRGVKRWPSTFGRRRPYGPNTLGANS